MALAVLMPVYNPDAGLQLTLESLRKQTVPFKLFLVDDGSTYQTDYQTLTKGIDVCILRLPKNLGITGALNAGLADIMKGKFQFIARIDAGDAATPDRFSKQLAALQSHPEISILGSQVELRDIDDQGKLIATRIWALPLTPDACLKQMRYNVAVCHPAMMIRRVVFDVLHSYSDEYPAAEDFELTWRAAKAGFKISNLNEVLLIKEETPGSISQKRRRRQIYSRLRILWANRKLTSADSWAGLLRSAITLLFPTKAMNTLKRLAGRS